MILALVPIVPVKGLAVPTLSAGAGVKGDTIEVTGADNDAPAGTVIELYWDDTTVAWNGVKGKLNSTTAKGSGNYEVWFDIPEAKNGNHYVWIKSVATGETKSIVIAVNEKVSLSSTSGLRGDKVDITGYGLASEKDVAYVLVAGAATAIGAWPWTASTDDITFSAGETEYDGTLAKVPIEPGTLTIDLDGAAGAHAPILIDNGDGTLIDDVDIDVVTALNQFVSGSINYATGEWDIEFDAAPAADFQLGYNGFVKVVDNFYSLSSGTSNTVGTTTKRVTIPNENAGAEPANGAYSIQTLDAKGNTGLKAFTVGAVITVTPEEGATGDLVTVKGRGFTAGETIVYGVPAIGADGIALSGTQCAVDDYPTAPAGVAVNLQGEFTMTVIIPEMVDEDEYVIQVGDGVLYAEADFEVTELASVTVTPDYGPQGQTISIEGENFPNKKDSEVQVLLSGGGLGADVAIKTFDTNADGSFSGTFRVPAELDDTYDIKAKWVPAVLGGDNIMTTATFRIGSVLVLLSDDEGASGLTVTLSGNGFTAGKGWNATFGDVVIFEDEVVAAGGLLKDAGAAAVFFVPQVEPGVYDITVVDEDTEITVVTQFTVTDETAFEFDAPTAPSGYNVTLTGTYWSEDAAPTFEFWLFNTTEEWDITGLVSTGGGAPAINFATGLPDGDHPGDWEAWWIVGTAAGDLDMGSYTLNITYGDDFFMQVPFEVGDEHVSLAPRKSTFRIGDTVSFNLEHSFGNVAAGAGGEINNGNMKIYDPSGELYWTTNGLVTWTKSGMYYMVPISAQTSNGNPMVLLDDAPLGTWTYEWYKNANPGDSELIDEGSFDVAAAEADVISSQVEDLNNKITGLEDSIADVTGEFDEVKDDIASVATLAEQAVTAAQQAAEAVETVAQTANTATQAAEDAATAANEARDAANGLTTLVYGAIGAALVAALAAIVSLMQISRRIAG
jgi:archaellum component FlaC